MTLPAHGPNVGHGNTKYTLIDAHGRRSVVLPSVLAKAPSHVSGQLARVPVVTAASTRWWTGEDAQLSASAFTILSQDRLTDPAFIPALVQAAVQRFGHLNGSLSGVCVSCLPASWCEQAREVDGQRVANANEKALGARLREALGATTFSKIRIISEPVALANALLLDDDGREVGDPKLASGHVGIVDLGHRTVGKAEIRRQIVLRDSLDTFTLGTVVPLGQIRARLSAYFEREFSIQEVDQAIRVGYVVVAGARRPLPRGWDAPLIENGTTIAARLVEAWGKGLHLDLIAVGGGGAELEILTDRIAKRFGHAQVASEPQLAPSIGCARLGRRLAGR